MHALCVRRLRNAVQIRGPGRKMRGQIPSVHLAATLAVYQGKFVPVPERITADVSRLMPVSEGFTFKYNLFTLLKQQPRHSPSRLLHSAPYSH